jgi:hypothetical protein
MPWSAIVFWMAAPKITPVRDAALVRHPALVCYATLVCHAIGHAVDSSRWIRGRGSAQGGRPSRRKSDGRPGRIYFRRFLRLVLSRGMAVVLTVVP